MDIPACFRSRRHQHYHSQRSARSQDVSMHSTSSGSQPGSLAQPQAQSNGVRPMSSYYEYETVQQQRVGSIKHSHSSSATSSSSSPINVPHWKAAAMNGYSPASLNSSARSRGPFVTQVTIREQSSGGIPAHLLQQNQQQQLQQQQPTYQTVQKMSGPSQYGSAAGSQPHASKV